MDYMCIRHVANFLKDQVKMQWTTLSAEPWSDNFKGAVIKSLIKDKFFAHVVVGCTTIDFLEKALNFLFEMDKDNVTDEELILFKNAH